MERMQRGSRKMIVNISSAAASLSLHTEEASRPHPKQWSVAGLAFKSAMVARNLQTVVLANALREDGFIVVSMHPGTPLICLTSYLMKIQISDFQIQMHGTFH